MINVLGICGSLRPKSYNLGALNAMRENPPEGARVTLIEIGEIPFYASAIEKSGFNPAILRLREAVARADALLVAVPEYNFSMPGVLKNALEWLSRQPDPPANNKPCAIFGVTTGTAGTARAQMNFRAVAVSLNLSMVNAPHVDVMSAPSKYDGSGKLTDAASIAALFELVVSLRDHTLRARR